MPGNVILLAGGRAARMGMPKGLVEVRGRKWLSCQLAALSACDVESVVIVLGYFADEYVRAIEAETWPLAIDCVHNDKPELGPFTSIQTGARFLAAHDRSRFGFVLPIDVPVASPRIWVELGAALDANSELDAAIPECEGRGGHPVVCSTAFLDHLLTMDPSLPDARLDLELRKRRVARVPVSDRRVLMNLNTPDDFAALDA